MLYSEIIAVCSQIHTKHINTLCGQNAEFANVKPGGTYSDHWVIKRYKPQGSQQLKKLEVKRITEQHIKSFPNSVP
jgi:sulfite reductase beta subunit-like hemoprotein